MPYSQPDKAPTLFDLFSLKGKNAVVIGGSGLLGGEISYAFAEMGARLIIANRNFKKTETFIDTLSFRYPTVKATALSVDISSKKSIATFTKQVASELDGGLDILVNCGWSGNKNSFESITDEDWDNDIEVCLNGVFRTTKMLVPLLSRRKGNILNIASMYGHVAPDYRLYDGDRFANPPSYGAAKAGVIQLTKYLASFLSQHEIRVNCISPGPFPFEKTQDESPEFIRRLSDKNPMNRIGNPHELKGAALLLCSNAGSYITGQNLRVDGGWSIW